MRLYLLTALALTASPALADQTAVKPAKPPEVVICKSELQTGSMYRRHRVCLTKKQWEYVRDENVRFARAMVLKGQGQAE